MNMRNKKTTNKKHDKERATNSDDVIYPVSKETREGQRPAQLRPACIIMQGDALRYITLSIERWNTCSVIQRKQRNFHTISQSRVQNLVVSVMKYLVQFAPGPTWNERRATSESFAKISTNPSPASVSNSSAETVASSSMIFSNKICFLDRGPAE